MEGWGDFSGLLFFGGFRVLRPLPAFLGGFWAVDDDDDNADDDDGDDDDDDDYLPPPSRR